MTTTPLPSDDTFDDEDDFGGPDLACLSCGGDGFVDSVAGESCRYGWDDDGPGTCPNCDGSGLRKDQKWF
jgi:hypothetical protein